MVTDGEFNSLRTQGETRPVHIWQVIHDARESVSRQRAVTLEKMLKKNWRCVNSVLDLFVTLHVILNFEFIP